MSSLVPSRAALRWRFGTTSLVAVVIRDHEAAIVTRTILGLAKRMGLIVCAEGVEDQATFDVMAKWGCHKIQGFYIGRPAPSAALDFDGYKQWASGRSQESTGNLHGNRPNAQLIQSR